MIWDEGIRLRAPAVKGAVSEKVVDKLFYTNENTLRA
jgi:hypothetical protein